MKYKKLFDFIDELEIPNKKDLDALYECLNDKYEMIENDEPDYFASLSFHKQWEYKLQSLGIIINMIIDYCDLNEVSQSQWNNLKFKIKVHQMNYSGLKRLTVECEE